MKIRTDFVTNSSSSSFVVSFSSKDSVEEVLKSELAYLDDDRYYKCVCEDVLQNGKSLDEILEVLREEYESRASNEIYDSFHSGMWDRPQSVEYSDFLRLRTEKYHKRVGELTEEYLKEFKERHDPNGFYACLEYGDDDGDFYSDLEYDIMPNIADEVFSHH